jgi:hypothetical protein
LQTVDLTNDPPSGCQKLSSALGRDSPAVIPRRRSRSSTRLLNVDCLIPSLCAARVKLIISAVIVAHRSCRISMDIRTLPSHFQEQPLSQNLPVRR